ncbi:NUDIX hydrolase [Candidatus Saccharibacteria bacterium]|nr:NUDIX hydrolase [Candidatus Saccharibacteria bacterium]MBP7834512.1 NUDIX hydrolase [Candidatus Saccharibacteria bacterium]
MMNRILPKNARLVPRNALKKYNGEIFDIYQWKQKMYDGSLATFEMAKRTDTVQILAIDGNDIIAVNEEQPDGTKREYGLPGGRIDPDDESPLHAAKREMQEETGYSFKKWKLLNVHQPQRKVEWFIYVYVAWDVLETVQQQIDVGEKIDVMRLSWREYLEKGNKYTIFENNLHRYDNVEGLLTTKEFNEEDQ